MTAGYLETSASSALTERRYSKAYSYVYVSPIYVFLNFKSAGTESIQPCLFESNA